MQSQRRLFLTLLGAVATFAPVPIQAATPGPPANMSMVAGNGQVVELSFLTTVPLTILVTDASGIPVPGVPVSWAITQGADTGTLNSPAGQTDSNGLATTNFISTFIQPGLSYNTYNVTATTSVGVVTFFETAVPFETLSGQLAQPPYVQLNLPTLDHPVISGTAGSILPGAVTAQVVAQSNLSLGQGIPDVGMRIIATNGGTAPASCNAPASIAMSDANGNISCDLVLGNTPGSFTANALVGEFQNTRQFTINITPGQTCTFSIGPTSQTFASTAGGGTVTVTAPTGCNWTATSNATSFLNITSGFSGSGNGSVSYSITANTGAARSGTLSIAGQTFTVTQNGVSNPSQLTIQTGQNLPGAVVSASYSTGLAATGGSGSYSWSQTGGTLPPGLILNASGLISGSATTTGNYTFTATVSDGTGATQSQMFTIVVSAAGTGVLTITNAGFPSGIANVPYSQTILYTQVACGSPVFPPVPTIVLQSGSLPPGLSVQGNGAGYAIAGTPTATGTYSFTLGISNTCGQSGSASFSISINGTGSTSVLSANPLSLTFNATQGGSSQTQPITLSSTGTAISFTATATTTSGGNWLSVTQSSASTPATLSVTINNLPGPGTYQGSINIAGSGNNNLAIPITLNVTGTVAGLSVIPNSLTYNSIPSGASSVQLVTVSSNVSGTSFNASAQTVTGGNWLSVQANSNVTPATLTVTVNTTGLTSGNYSGSINLSSSTAGTANIPVSLNVVKSSFFVDQTALTFTTTAGGPSPNSQVVNLIFSGAPFSVAASTTTFAGGSWLFVTQPVSGSTAVTVSVVSSGLGRGTYNGVVTLTPADNTIAPVKVNVTLTVGTGPGPVINGVVNSASNVPGGVSPGELVSIYGVNPGPPTPLSLTLTSNNTVSTSLGGIQVLFDNIPAPLTFVSTSQINAVVPYEVYGRSATQLTVTFNGVSSIAFPLAVVPTAPGIFTVLGPQPFGVPNQAEALNQDGTINSQGNGAAPGTIVTLFATGEGQTNPAGITGAITGSTLSTPLAPVLVKIGGFTATVTYAGTAPGLVAGVMQVNVRVPGGVPRGSQASVVITVGGVDSNQASIAIAP